MRSRLYDGRAGDRVAVHPVPPGSGEGWLFTATGRLAADDGQLLEEPLIPVCVPRNPDGSAADAGQDADADTRRFRARPARGGPAITGQARERLAAGYEEAAALALKEATRRLRERAAEVQAQLSADAERLAADLGRWYAAELAEAGQHLGISGGTWQPGLFADTGHGAFRTIEEARALIDEEFRRRRKELATGFGVAEPAAPELVGCLLLVEAG
jgi:hypothetical protein